VVTDHSALLELAAEVSSIGGQTIRDWEITSIGDQGSVLGARGVRGAFNIAVDTDGNFITYFLKMPEAALAELAQQVAHRAPISAVSSSGGTGYFKVDRLGWQLTFRRLSPEAAPEVWSIAEQDWRATKLLGLLKNPDQALTPLDPELADHWRAVKPNPAPAESTTPSPGYFVLNEPPALAALWLAPALDGTLQWRQFVAAEGRLVPLTEAEMDQLRAGRELVEVSEPAFNEALAALRTAHKQSQ